jgi:hypothetical protein
MSKDLIIADSFEGTIESLMGTILHWYDTKRLLTMDTPSASASSKPPVSQFSGTALDILLLANCVR